MDYIDIVKRAFNTAWKYKILWLFGLFAAGMSGGGGGYGGGSSNWSTGSSDYSSVSGDQLTALLPVLVAVAVFFALLGIVFFILTFAAQGGLVHLVNEAEEGRPVQGGPGWRVGFRYWGRVFLLDLIIVLPLLVVIIVFMLIFGASIVGIVAASTGLQSGGSAGSLAGAIGAGIAGLCLGIFVLVAAVIAYAIIFGTTGQLALRYAVLDDRTAVDSIRLGWSDLWGKRGAVAMFFVLYLTGLVYSIIMTLVLMVIVVPAFFMIISGAWPVAVFLGLLAFVVALVPGAAYSAFVSSAWTIFWRRMTGREAPAVRPSPAYAAPPGYPPPPPGAWGAPAAAPQPEPAPQEEPPPQSGSAAGPQDDPWKAAHELPPVPDSDGSQPGA